jgi:hypothetical protein
MTTAIHKGMAILLLGPLIFNLGLGGVYVLARRLLK